MKVLLAIDGSPCSTLAVNEVAVRPWPLGSEIKVLSVSESLRIQRPSRWVFNESYYEQLESTALERARLNVQMAVQQLRAAQPHLVTVTSEVLTSGKPQDVILEVASQWGADVIVVGSHGHHGWKQHWLGSVSQAVAAHAPCSVQIVRCCPMKDRLTAGTNVQIQ